ncbi:unnamed protein product [Linum trigynum]|uniref:Uncharacterized protein n=1 Tax=Linum trigynum TaxID=586398 RepID=A0AAV2E599_9ROSI
MGQEKKPRIVGGIIKGAQEEPIQVKVAQGNGPGEEARKAHCTPCSIGMETKHEGPKRSKLASGPTLVGAC